MRVECPECGRGRWHWGWGCDVSVESVFRALASSWSVWFVEKGGRFSALASGTVSPARSHGPHPLYRTVLSVSFYLNGSFQRLLHCLVSTVGCEAEIGKPGGVLRPLHFRLECTV